MKSKKEISIQELLASGKPITTLQGVTGLNDIGKLFQSIEGKGRGILKPGEDALSILKE